MLGFALLAVFLSVFLSFFHSFLVMAKDRFGRVFGFISRVVIFWLSQIFMLVDV